ncbi:MAG: DnaJ domain-containing protein [Acidobacteria bacterium]|nr:DnaJ domain-containing protein [Acidobacteriota bacterium]
MQHAAASTDIPDHYELLQISASAEPETIQRVYRMLAQRYHPDNQQTGDPTRFRALVEAYEVLSDPVRRAQYDMLYNEQRQVRWRPVSAGPRADNPIEVEQLVRLTVLEVLYERRRTEPNKSGIFVLDLEPLTGQPREHLEFTVWYLTKRGYVVREDNSKLSITVDGVDYLETHYLTYGMRKRLEAHSDAA